MRFLALVKVLSKCRGSDVEAFGKALALEEPVISSWLFHHNPCIGQATSLGRLAEQTIPCLYTVRSNFCGVLQDEASDVVPAEPDQHGSTASGGASIPSAIPETQAAPGDGLDLILEGDRNESAIQAAIASRGAAEPASSEGSDWTPSTVPSDDPVRGTAIKPTNPRTICLPCRLLLCCICGCIVEAGGCTEDA